MKSNDRVTVKVPHAQVREGIFKGYSRSGLARVILDGTQGTKYYADRFVKEIGDEAQASSGD